jgi:hypothetical protein
MKLISMFRKISYVFGMIFLAAAVCLLSSCGEEAENGADSTTGTPETSAEVTVTEPPATTEPPTTTDPGPRKLYKDLIFGETFIAEDNHPIKVGDDGFTSIGAKFTADFTMTSLEISCPSWSDNVGKMTFKLYKWDTDYVTTAAGTPVLTDTETFVDYADNSIMEVAFPEEIEAGTYLWELSEGTGGVGLWAHKTAGAEGLEFYANGELMTDGSTFDATLYGYAWSEPQ